MRVDGQRGEPRPACITAEDPGMRVVLKLLAVVVVFALAGCANFGAVRRFAAETTTMTGTVRAELEQMARLCEFPADMQLLLDEANGRQDQPGATGRRLKAACASVGAESVELQRLSVDALDGYAAALLAMAEDSNFEVRSAIDATGAKVAALQTRDGAALVNPEKAGALTRLIGLVSDIVLRHKREEGVRKLLEVEGDLAGVAGSLREFFVRRDGGQSPYENVVRTGAGLRRDLQTDLGLVAKQEPVRAAELRRTIPPDAVFTDRLAASGGKIPAEIAKRVDDWTALLPAFRKDALTPDPKALFDQLDTFRTRALETRRAIDQAGF